MIYTDCTFCGFAGRVTWTKSLVQFVCVYAALRRTSPVVHTTPFIVYFHSLFQLIVEKQWKRKEAPLTMQEHTHTHTQMCCPCASWETLHITMTNRNLSLSHKQSCGFFCSNWGRSGEAEAGNWFASSHQREPGVDNR